VKSEDQKQQQEADAKPRVEGKAYPGGERKLSSFLISIEFGL